MEKQARQRLRWIAIAAAAGAGLLVLCVFAIGMGSVSIPPARVVEVLLGRVASTEPDAIIVTNMRLARVVASLLGGQRWRYPDCCCKASFTIPSRTRTFWAFPPAHGCRWGL